jgi:hypothetical protein
MLLSVLEDKEGFTILKAFKILKGILKESHISFRYSLNDTYIKKFRKEYKEVIVYFGSFIDFFLYRRDLNTFIDNLFFVDENYKDYECVIKTLDLSKKDFGKSK